MSRVPHRRRLTSASVLVALLIAIAGYLYSLTGPEPVPPSFTPPPDPDPTLPAPAAASGRTAKFDYYVLALSWSPDYCASNGDDDPQQCRTGRKLGFVLHGLWPQYAKGYPSDCSTAHLPDATKTKYPGLYPSPKLYDHEWEKHGTCSGLAPDDYLAFSKKLQDSIVIPAPYRAPEQPIRVTSAALKKDLVAANPALNESALAVYCSGSGRYLTELQVCFSIEGRPLACGSDVQSQAGRSCQSADFLMRSVR